MQKNKTRGRGDARSQLLRKRRQAAVPVLDKLGIRDDFDALPRSLRESILLGRLRPPEVILDSSIAPSTRADQVKADVEERLQRPTLRLKDDSARISANELCNVVVPLFFKVKIALGTTKQSALIAISERMGDFMRLSESEFCQHLLNSVALEVQLAVSGHSRIDERIYTADVRMDATAEKPRLKVTLMSVPAERITLTCDGERRPAFACGIHAGNQTVGYCRWGSSVLGRDGGEPLPVYVQSHVLHRLFERLHTANDRGDAHTFLVESLLAPSEVRRVGDDYWSDLQDHEGNRLGYLVSRVIEEKVLVRTFLFLTMQGSPEAAMLFDELGARRRDIEHLRLDELGTFLNSDISDDQELVQIFERCGCGHLLRLNRTRCRTEPRRMQAAAIRRHFGLPEGAWVRPDTPDADKPTLAALSHGSR